VRVKGEGGKSANSRSVIFALSRSFLLRESAKKAPAPSSVYLTL
jgi:hypothetical protein